MSTSPHLKQSSVADIAQYLNELKPKAAEFWEKHKTPVLTGAGIGAGAMTLASLGGPKLESPARRRRRLLSNFALGGLLGAGAGAALPAGMDALEAAAPKPSPRDEALERAKQVYAEGSAATHPAARLLYAATGYSVPKAVTRFGFGNTDNNAHIANHSMRSLLNEITAKRNDITSKVQTMVDDVLSPKGKNRKGSAPQTANPVDDSIINEIAKLRASGSSADAATLESQIRAKMQELVRSKALNDPEMHALMDKFKTQLPNARLGKSHSVPVRHLTHTKINLQELLQRLDDRPGLENDLMLKRWQLGGGAHGKANLRAMPGMQRLSRGFGPLGNATSAVGGFFLPEIVKLLAPNLFKTTDVIKSTVE